MKPDNPDRAAADSPKNKVDGTSGVQSHNVSHNARRTSRKPLAVVTIVLAVALALIVGGYFGYKFYKNRQAVSPPPITDLENKPDIKREDTGVNLSKNNRTGIGEVITGDAQ